jgi:ornithine cyclodeaminase
VEVLVLGHEEVRALLPMAECVDVMIDVLSARARGEAQMPLRQVMWLPDRHGALASMPAYVSPDGLGAKLVSAFPGNSQTPYESHQGAVVLFEADHGSVEAILDAATVTAVRTAAVSAAATRTLARPEAAAVAILGTGRQAALHAEAMVTVRAVRRIRLWGRSRERAEALAGRLERTLGLPVEAVGDVRTALVGADIVCTTTSSTEPILPGRLLPEGCHINAAGASVPGYRELDSEAIARSRLYVDAREAAASESDELRIAHAEGRIGPDHVLGELGELFLERVAGRRDAAEITLFESFGLAVEDIAAARLVVAAARARGIGSRVEFGAMRTSG